MGMATQLIFTAIITLMKIAILLTYLRMYHLLRTITIICSDFLRYFPVKTQQVVLQRHAVLHYLAQRSLLLRHSVSVRVSRPAHQPAATLLIPFLDLQVPTGTSSSILARQSA